MSTVPEMDLVYRICEHGTFAGNKCQSCEVESLKTQLSEASAAAQDLITVAVCAQECLSGFADGHTLGDLSGVRKIADRLAAQIRAYSRRYPKDRPELPQTEQDGRLPDGHDTESEAEWSAKPNPKEEN